MRFRSATLVVLLMLSSAVAYGQGLDCPKGTTPNGERTPEASEAWCETPHKGTVVLHGPYRAWWPNGQLGTEGQYRYDKAVGLWKGWHPNGKLQGEESFADGRLVKGRYWDQNGKQIPRPP